MIHKKAQGSDRKTELAYIRSRLAEIEGWIDNEEDPEVKEEMAKEFQYTLENRILDAINSYFR